MENWSNLDVTVNNGTHEYRLLCEGYYYNSDGNPCINAYRDDEHGPWGTLTVNVAGWTAKDENEILVKTWSENESWTSDILLHGPFEDTGRRVPTGFVQAQVWRYTGV
tara:strand:- start:955 stop:1278 length:324 start_codon:yes stop_codon:yes gene_type:complete